MIANPQDDDIIVRAEDSGEDINICRNSIKKRMNETEQCYHNIYTKQRHPNSYTKQRHPDSYTKQRHPDSYTKQCHPNSYTKQCQQNSPTPNSYPKLSLAVWPPELISILHQTMATPCQHPSKPIFEFNLSVKAAKKNFIILTCIFGGNLHKALHAQHGSLLSYGSKFKQILILEPIFGFHPSWTKIKTVLIYGLTWSLLLLNDSNQLNNIDDALAFGDHKGATQQPELLLKLIWDNIDQGFTLPLPLNKIKQLLGILLAPLNIQLQKTINEHGEIIPKNRMTHNQSWKWQSGTSVNSRVNKEQLMPCYFGQVLKRLINWAVATRKLHPKKRILTTKLDIKAAFR
jgi:hypothetical protein